MTLFELNFVTLDVAVHLEDKWASPFLDQLMTPDFRFTPGFWTAL